MKIPEEKIAEIRESTDIIDVVSQYVTLKKRGKTFMGLCPFHNEKSPSFSVDPARGFYHCFGCGEGGNVFSFVMAMEKVSFPEAVRSLAEKAGISIVFSQADEDAAKETEILYHVNQIAADFFKDCLMKTEAGKRAFGYFIGRGFSKKIIETFGIGYAPNRWDGLIQKAGRSPVALVDLAKAGLIVGRKDGSGYYDRFRGRLMFPIFNPSGRIVGFGGRILTKGEDAPKYINTPETAVYRKSRLLYGLYQSAAGIRSVDRALLVEGYTDVMRLHQEGFTYAVASAGTALTEEQAVLLTRYSKRVTLVYDGDSAGFQAALRGVDILVGAGHHVDVSPLPGGSDPDSYLKTHGRKALQSVLDGANSFIDFRLEMLRKEGKLESSPDRARAARVLMETIARVKDPLERNLLVKEAAEKLGLDEALLGRQLQKGSRVEAETQTSPANPSKTEAAERGLLGLLLEDMETWAHKLFLYVEPEAFCQKDIRLVIASLHQAYLQNSLPDTGVLLDKHSDSPAIEKLITGLLQEGLDDDVDRDQFAFDCVLRLKEASLNATIQSISKRIHTEQSKGIDVTKLSKEWMALKDNRARLRVDLETAWKKNVEI